MPWLSDTGDLSHQVCVVFDGIGPNSKDRHVERPKISLPRLLIRIGGGFLLTTSCPTMFGLGRRQNAEAGPSRPTAPPQTVEQDIPESVEASLPPASSWLGSIISDNPYFSAGAGLMGIGVALTVLRRGSTLATTFAQRRMLVSLEIPSRDRSYAWFLEWMAEQARQQGTSAAWIKGKARMMRSHELAVETSYKQHSNGSSEAVFNLVPGPGTHYFRYRGAWFQVSSRRSESLKSGETDSRYEARRLVSGDTLGDAQLDDPLGRPSSVFDPFRRSSSAGGGSGRRQDRRLYRLGHRLAAIWQAP